MSIKIDRIIRFCSTSFLKIGIDGGQQKMWTSDPSATYVSWNPGQKLETTPIENIARKSPNLTKISQYYREYSIYDNIAKFSQYYSEILAFFLNRDISQFNSEFSQYYNKILAIFFNRDFAMK
jgi:hypothetical protein